MLLYLDTIKLRAIGFFQKEEKLGIEWQFNGYSGKALDK
jgi:hypothetical protein